MATALVVIFSGIGCIGWVFMLVTLSDPVGKLAVVSFGLMGLSVLFWITSSMYMEHAGDEASVVAKHEPNARLSHVFCVNQCANVPDEVVLSGNVNMDNGDGVWYELVLEPNEEYFGFFAASLPYNDQAPLSVEEVEEYLIDKLRPYVFGFADQIKAKSVFFFEALEAMGAELSNVKQLDLQRERFRIEILSYYQLRLLNNGWQIKEIRKFEVTRQYSDVN